jgi:hypothetical protein
VLRDRERNWLYNRLGLDEDSPDGEVRLEATPDCADMPYYLRAYFAWKMRLPFMFSSCTRGRGGAAPRCVRSFSNLDPPVDGLRAAGLLAAESATTDPGSAGTVTGGASDGGGPSLDAQLMELSQQDASITEPLAFNHFMNDMMTRTVQSGAGRTLPGNSNSDLYPLALRREAIRPGVIFVDPYGHLLVVSQWQEATATSPGVLFAVDGHPDLSIGRKRFWQGAFLFVDDMSWGAGGFKAFRPVIAEEEDGVIELRRLNNYEIRHHPDWGNFSTEQYQLGTEGFYRRMDRVVNPTPLPPDVAQRAILDAFFELVQERVDSVAAGETYMARRNYRPITMPEGGDIFETSGRWEDYSTPARDLRLLIAIDLVQGFPRRLTAHPEDFALPPGAEPAAVARQLGQSAAEFLRGHGVSYRRSNGEDQRLTLMQVIERQVDLEMAYNPNDCVEIRWAAPAGSTERGTCARHAPDEQRERMESYRTWFHTRIRPPRE